MSSHTAPTERVALNRQEQRTAATREALLDAALQVLGDVGYNEATVGLIVKAARRAHGTFYVHFANKEEIYAALLQQMRERLHLDSRSVWDNSQPVVSIHKSIDLYVRSFEEDRVLWELLDGSSATSELFRDARRALRAALATDIRKGILSTRATARLEGMDVALVCDILAAMLEETCATFLLYRDTGDRDRITQHMTVMWARMLGYEAAGDGLPVELSLVGRTETGSP